MNFRRPPIESSVLRKSAGHDAAHCMFEIPDVCRPGIGQSLCHVRAIGESGMGMKTDDTSAAFGCSPCHDVIDGRRSLPGMERGSADWLFYTSRALRRQVAWWVTHGFLQIRKAA